MKESLFSTANISSEPVKLPANINLVGAGFKGGKRDFAPLLLFCLLIILPLDFVGLVAWYNMKVQNNSRDQKIEKMLEKDPVTPEMLDELGEKIQAINNIIDGKSFSWTNFLNDLEALVPRRVKLTGIRMREGLITTITAQARSMNDILEFIRNLEGSPNFDQPFISTQRIIESKEYWVSINFEYIFRVLEE